MMLDDAINRVRRAIYDAENCGAQEIIDGLKPLEEALIRRKCREGMELNCTTAYCIPGCCPDWHNCSLENGFNVHGEPAADDEKNIASRNWLGGGAIRPRMWFSRGRLKSLTLNP